jgi:PAS domain S-box-containing protein
MRLPILRKYAPASLVGVGAAVFLSLLVVVIYEQDRATLQIRDLIGDTRHILGEANKLNILIRDAERGQRGYLLSGKPEYLEPYEAALKRLPIVFELLRQRSAGNAERQREFDALWSAIEQKLAELALTIKVRAESGEEPARQILMTDRGRDLMTDITARLNTVVEEENQQLTERRAAWERRDGETRLLIAAGSGITVLFLGLAALLLRHNAAQRRDLERDREQESRSELERSQADLREMTVRNAASQYARSLLEASLDPLVTISTDGKITDLNEATIQATGVRRDVLIGTDFAGYFTEPEKAREAYRRVFADGSVIDYPLTIRQRNQHLTEVMFNASVYKDADDNVLGMFAAARDVTAQRKAEAAIAEQRGKELERLEDLERFQKLTVGRELKMIELKKEIVELKLMIRGSAESFEEWPARRENIATA